MNLRESIAYNIDLITGKKQYLVKEKPNLPVKGIATVELFDSESGEKLYEAKTENVINNIVSKLAYMDYFYGKIKGSRTASYYSAPFQNIVLTEYSGAEDPDIPYYKGGLIGYADKATQYVGNDVFKGTINTAESRLDTLGDGVLHYVFDFPTHAANGTFQSIWWIGDLTTSPSRKNTFNVQCPCTRTDGISGGSSYYPGFVLNRAGNKWVCIIGQQSCDAWVSIFYPKYALVLNDDFTFYKYINISGKLSSSIINTFCGWGTSDNGIIIINGYSKTSNLAIIDIDTEQVTTLSLDTTNIGNQYITVNMKGNKVYVSGSKFCEYVLNGTTFTLVRNYGNATAYFFTDFNNSIAYLNDSKNVCYIENGIVKTTPILINTSAFQRHLKYRANNNEIGYTVENITQDGNFVTLTIGEYSIGTQVGAQTLLAASVTKTPTNTMKIQYDFQIEKVL